MEKKTGWLRNVLFGVCLTVMSVLFMPMTSQATNYRKFGENIAGAMMFNYMNEMVGQNRISWYKIEEDGILTISIPEVSKNSNNIYLKINAFDASGNKNVFKGGDLILDLEERVPFVLKVGARKGSEVALEFSIMHGTKMEITNFKYSVSFEKQSYCESMDDSWRAYAMSGNKFETVVLWAKSEASNKGQVPIPLYTKNVMYKGFLHGHFTTPYKYENRNDVDDVDTWDVTLQKNGDYKIYFDGLDGLRKAGSGYFITFSTPTQTYNDIHNNLQYDKERKLYYYPYKADQTGTYDIRIGGGFGTNVNIPYSLGVYETLNGWIQINGKDYWYENNVRQGYDPSNPSYRDKEIYDPGTDAWYWLDNVQGGARAVSKDVYQESDGGKWVRYNANGGMVKGWNDQNGMRYYFDLVTGAMYKGLHNISGQDYYFDDTTGGLYTGWIRRDGKDYWYENGIQQGLEGRGKEIYDPGTDAWYWLDSIYGGAKAVSKEVYQEADGGKWVRYNENGRMIKGWHNSNGKNYYYDLVTGAMQKGWVTINGGRYHFDENTGVLQ